jgi:hypothetical protein
MYNSTDYKYYRGCETLLSSDSCGLEKPVAGPNRHTIIFFETGLAKK